MFRLTVFASGNGTNAENIIRYFSNHNSISIQLIITDNPTAGVIERAKKLGIETYTTPFNTEKDISDVISNIQKRKISFIVLAGFLKLIPSKLISAFPNRIVNIHPALLPDYGGKGMYGNRVHEAVVRDKQKESGITIHYVNEHYDDGKIIAQYRCPVEFSDTPETLAQRIHKLEYLYYPQVIEQVILQKLPFSSH